MQKMTKEIKEMNKEELRIYAEEYLGWDGSTDFDAIWEYFSTENIFRMFSVEIPDEDLSLVRRAVL
jgi:hypothetical protein